MATIQCPVSAGRLEEMYWKEKMTIAEIASHLSSFFDDGTVIKPRRVRGYFYLYGIKTVAPKNILVKYPQCAANLRKGYSTEAHTTAARRNIEIAREAYLRNKPKRDAKKAKTASVEKIQRKDARDHYVSLLCSWCKKKYEIKRGIYNQRIRRGCVNLFCSSSCRMKNTNSVRRFNKIVSQQKSFDSSDSMKRSP
jgi:hypothetical protein